MKSTANVTYKNVLNNPCLNKLSLLPINEETTIKICDDTNIDLGKRDESYIAPSPARCGDVNPKSRTWPSSSDRWKKAHGMSVAFSSQKNWLMC